MNRTLMAMAVAGGLAFSTAPAMATDIVQFADLDGAGVPTGSFITLDKLNTIITTGGGTYQSVSNLGADNLLTTGDTFSEVITLVTSSSQVAGGGTSFALGGDYRIEATLTGIYTNVDNGVGPGVSINADGSVNGLLTTTFTLAFNPNPLSTLQLYNNVTGEQIAELDLTSGGATETQLVAGEAIGDVTINALLGTDAEPFQTVGDTYILDEFGNSLIDVITATITTGSGAVAQEDDALAAGFPAPVYGDPDTNQLFVVLTDNGFATDFSIPTPAPLALIGLALVGLAARRKRS